MSFEELSNILSDEVISEIAENFFGARRHLDDLLEGFQNLVRKLKDIELLVKARFGVLHHLLLRGAEARAFYQALGLDPALADYAKPGLLRPTVSPGFALSLKGRYTATVQAAYVEARSEAEAYMHGRSYVDAHDRGKRKISANYVQLRELSASINQVMERVNRNLTPSGVLQYVRTFDVEERARERVVGSPEEGYAANLDKGLAFQPIRFETLGVSELPEMPEPAAVAATIRSFCARVCAAEGSQVETLLKELKQAREAIRHGPGKG